MKNDSLTYSVKVWIFGVLLLPLITSWMIMIPSWSFGRSELISFLLLSPIMIWAFSLPLHFPFVWGNKILFKKIKNERVLRIIINLIIIFIIGLFYLFFSSVLEDYPIKDHLFLIGIEIILSSIMVWGLKIEREKLEQKRPPTRPDILDDNLE